MPPNICTKYPYLSLFLVVSFYVVPTFPLSNYYLEVECDPNHHKSIIRFHHTRTYREGGGVVVGVCGWVGVRGTRDS